eukprot:s765_g24.t1
MEKLSNMVLEYFKFDLLKPLDRCCTVGDEKGATRQTPKALNSLATDNDTGRFEVLAANTRRKQCFAQSTCCESQLSLSHCCVQWLKSCFKTASVIESGSSLISLPTVKVTSAMKGFFEKDVSSFNADVLDE